MHPRRYANTAVLLATVATGGCEPRTRRTPDDTVVVLLEAAATTADPRNSVSRYDGRLNRLVAAGLTAVDTDSMIPRLELASRIARIDDLTIDVTVRDDARFSDGSSVTAADVAGTYMNVLAPES